VQKRNAQTEKEKVELQTIEGEISVIESRYANEIKEINAKTFRMVKVEQEKA
jgi:hypothetical protein